MAEPVINLCEVQRDKTSPNKATQLQKLMRTKPGIILLILFAILVGVLPCVAFPPIVFVLTWTGVASHYNTRRFIDFTCGSWLVMISAIFEYVLGIKTKTFGFHGKFKRRSLFIMNHVSHLDWLYFWSVIGRHGDLTVWKVVTKSVIKNLPILGPSMQCCCLLFIERNWNKDEKEFRDKLYYFNSLDYPCQLLLFPEGGDLTYKSKKRSDTFADKEGLTRYKYCLHPRTRGFVYIMNALRNGELDAVYDVTIAYPDNLPKTESDFINGVMPHEIDFHIRAYDNKDLPSSDDKLAQWCQEKWQEKEERLHSFYSNGTFVEPITVDGSATSNGNHPDPCHRRNNKTVYQVQQASISERHYWQLVQYMLMLLTLNIVVACLLYFHWLFVFYFALAFLFMLLFSHFVSGFDSILLALQRNKIEEAVQISKKKHFSVANGVH